MNEFHQYISSLPEIIEDARNGRMFILVDAEDRENEGDLVIPAQMCTPQAVNFMARFGRGLICLSLTQERADQLMLPMMAGMLVTSIGSGQLISRTGRYKLFPIAGTAVMASGLFFLSRMKFPAMVTPRTACVRRPSSIRSPMRPSE